MANMNTPQQPGITLRSYPPSLTGAELDTTGILAAKLARKSPRFAGWLLEIVNAERQRRESEDTADPVEVQLPDVNAARWPDGELCAALVASFIAVRLADDLPTLKNLLVEAHATLCAWIAARFGGRS